MDLPFRQSTTLPPRLFAIGDLHGCDAELQVLLTHLVEKEKLTAEDQVVFVGDFIDRGPSSKGVIDLLLTFRQSFPATVFLRGNHEDMLLDYLGMGGTMGKAYMFNGGIQFLSSYGISSLSDAVEIVDSLPAEHIAFLTSLERAYMVGDFIFAHAGLNPNRSLEEQLDQDLFWIRQEFIHHPHNFQKTVIFGHTPYQDVLFDLPYKIGIDTGLVFGNMLTAIELVGKRLLQIEKGETEVRESEYSATSQGDPDIENFSESEVLEDGDLAADSEEGDEDDTEDDIEGEG